MDPKKASSTSHRRGQAGSQRDQAQQGQPQQNRPRQTDQPRQTQQQDQHAGPSRTTRQRANPMPPYPAPGPVPSAPRMTKIKDRSHRIQRDPLIPMGALRAEPDSPRGPPLQLPPLPHGHPGPAFPNMLLPAPPPLGPGDGTQQLQTPPGTPYGRQYQPRDNRKADPKAKGKGRYL